MIVIYPGPGGQTYHPKLGKLIVNEPFELADDEAGKYIESGLLKKKKPVKSKTKNADSTF